MRLSYNYAWLVDDEIFVRAHFKPGFVEDCRDIAGRRWEPKDKLNVFPITEAVSVKALADKWSINLSTEVLALLTVSVEELTMPSGQANLDVDEDGQVVVRFPYNPRLINTIKSMVPGCKWDNEKKYWKIPPSNYINMLEFAKANAFTGSDEFLKVMDNIIEQVTKAQNSSIALDADIVIPNMVGELLPYQRAGVAYLKNARKAILGDQPGLGKTIQALATIASEDAWPAVIVCPNTLKYNWMRETERFFPHLNVVMLDGTKPNPGGWDRPMDVMIVNYDILQERTPELFANGFESLIVDESHAIKNGKKSHVCPNCKTVVRSNTKNCKMCNESGITPVEKWTVKRTGAVMKLAKSLGNEKFVLLLTGTPITNRPMELVPQLEAIGQLDNFGGAWRFQNRYAPARNVATNTKELNDKLRATCFVRRRKRDIYEDLPELRNAVQYIEVAEDQMEWYKKVERDVIEYFAEKARVYAAEAGEDEAEAYWHKKMTLINAEHLVRLTGLRDAAAKIKHDSLIAWLDNFLESSDDEKVIVYAEHIELVEKIYAHYKDIAVKIRGGVSTRDRNDAVDRFQNDPTIRVFVANMTAASEGLTLTAASDVVFCELGWTPALHEQCASRCYGRVNDMHGATAWYLLAQSTIDEDIYSLLQRKRRIVDSVTDGVDITEGSSIVSDLIITLAERGIKK
jgi:SNF2 family DNA or RNA helicase